MLDVVNMSARLALDLDHDAIRLLSQQSDGWVVEGVAELDSADLTARITALRQRAEDLAGSEPAVLIVLPRSQVLYTEFDDLADPDRDVGPRLAGLTPYALAEITWDQATADSVTHVAAVALETLDEAMAFAASSRFRVVGLTSEPPEGAFPRLPVFQRLPGFLRDASAGRPLVLEPASPPKRRDVAFSGQRGVDYGPGRAAALTLEGAVRTGKAAARVPSQLAGLARRVPRPLLGAFAIGGAVLLGAALWPEGDPDPLAGRGFDRSFAELPAAMIDGLVPPTPAGPPAVADPVPARLSVRRAPALVEPVVIGRSGITADYAADIAPAESFEMVAALPALFGETRLPDTRPARPAAATAPGLPVPAPIGEATVARLADPVAPAPPPSEADGPKMTSVTAPEVTRVAAVLPDARVPGNPPASLAATLPEPSLLDVAPQEGPAPAAGETLAVGFPAAPDDAAAPKVRLAALPRGADALDRLPDAAVALLPAAPDEEFELGEDGFVVATPEGTDTPGGAVAIAGAPPLVAPPRPGSADEDPPANGAVAAAEPEEAPPVEVARANPNPELVSFLPRPRPGAADDPTDADTATVAVPDALITEALETGEEDTAAEPLLTASLVPRPRPARAVAVTPSAPSATAATATRAAPVAPQIPSRANVAREATLEDALPLGRLNLIGVYGSASDRRALVRLPTGQFVKLKVGDRIDGGQVAQIGPDRLLYQKGGRTLALDMPNT